MAKPLFDGERSAPAICAEADMPAAGSCSTFRSTAQHLLIRLPTMTRPTLTQPVGQPQPP